MRWHRGPPNNDSLACAYVDSNDPTPLLSLATRQTVGSMFALLRIPGASRSADHRAELRVSHLPAMASNQVNGINRDVDETGFFPSSHSERREVSLSIQSGSDREEETMGLVPAVGMGEIIQQLRALNGLSNTIGARHRICGRDEKRKATSISRNRKTQTIPTKERRMKT